MSVMRPIEPANPGGAGRDKDQFMSTATPAAGPDTAAVHPVIVYSKPACPQCDATKRTLGAKGISF